MSIPSTSPREYFPSLFLPPSPSSKGMLEKNRGKQQPLIQSHYFQHKTKTNLKKEQQWSYVESPT